MFFLKTLTKEMILEPKYFGGKLKQVLRRRVMDEMTGSLIFTEDGLEGGYVIAITKLNDDDIQTGLIEYDTGYVNFYVTYQAVIFRPVRNEVMDSIVVAVNELGFWTEVGALRVFVSRHQMTDDMVEGYDADRDAWISDDGEIEIKIGSEVRLRIIGSSYEGGDIRAIGTIRDDYLGLTSND